ncbi:MAG: hypothetical protein JW874_02810 [Spirochaetales bacterium]|nr:hypothetical protein [Spirochaetales bacterium]
MDRLITILESKRKNCSRGIQKALRGIDTRILSRIMNNLDPRYHHVILENMTSRSQEILRNEMENEKAFVKSAYNDKYSDLSENTGMFCDLLEMYTNENFDNRQEYPAFSAEINLDDPAGTVTTFYEISTWARKNGLMALDGIEEKTENGFFKKALEMMLLGTDPSIFEEILENYREQHVRKAATILQMIKTGMMSIQEGEHPEITRERLKSIDEG